MRDGEAREVAKNDVSLGFLSFAQPKAWNGGVFSHLINLFRVEFAFRRRVRRFQTSAERLTRCVAFHANKFFPFFSFKLEATKCSCKGAGWAPRRVVFMLFLSCTYRHFPTIRSIFVLSRVSRNNNTVVRRYIQYMNCGIHIYIGVKILWKMIRIRVSRCLLVSVVTVIKYEF